MRPTMDGGKPKKTAAVPPARRTGETPAKKKVTVSQATIDKIKAQGMTAAIKTAAAGGVSASYMEGVKRLYGASRLAKATAANINAASKPKAKSNFTYGANSAPAMPGKGPATRVATSAAAKKKNENPFGGFSMFARAVTSGAPKSKEKAAYLEAQNKRVAAARKKEAAARAARAAARNK